MEIIRDLQKIWVTIKWTKMHSSVMLSRNLTQPRQGAWILISFLKSFITFYLVQRKWISTLENIGFFFAVVLWSVRVSWWSVWFARSLSRCFALGQWPRTGIGLPCGPHHLGFLINNSSSGRQCYSGLQLRKPEPCKAKWPAQLRQCGWNTCRPDRHWALQHRLMSP